MFVYHRKAQYHETDQMGVIHHANYIKWMEEARIGWMDALGFPYAAIEDGGVVSPVVSLSASYKRPVRFNETIAVGVSVSTYTGVRLTLRYRFTDEAGETRAEAVSEHCFLKDGKIISLKKTAPALDEVLRQASKIDAKEDEA